MIPLRDVIPSRTAPVVTVALIALNLAAWFYELALPPDELADLLRVRGVVPADIDPPSLVSAMFLHGSWLHIIGNLWCLWIFGDNVEDRLGHGRFVLFYLLCGVGAALGHVAMDPESTLPTIGASGAIAGVMGAYFILYPRSRVLTLVPLIIIWDIVELPAVVLLGMWFLLQLLGAGAAASASGAAQGIAFWAHVAGFVLGAIAVVVLSRPSRRSRW
jgi:membrane associated rhomboid family serine protease